MQDIDTDKALEDLIRKHGDINRLPDLDADLFRAMSIDGDEFLDEFSTCLDVDLSGYLWYFHQGEEGCNLGAILFKPPYWRVNLFPLQSMS